MAKKVHIVPHMHWDREWYFTTEESRILLLNNMEEILSKLENESDYKFYVLDGQTCILEDFFAIKPYEKNRVKKLVQAGKLIIGPWYTQTDEMIVCGESIVRNMMYGIKDTEEFGGYMNIGYLPDSFGQSKQLPQILNGFGIRRAIFWRGISERHGSNKTEFFWTSSGDSKVLVELMPLGYAIGKYLPSNKEELKKRMDGYFNVLEKGATTDNILIPNGHDQMPVQKNIFEVIDILKEIYRDKDFFISNFNELFNELEKDTDKYDVVKGEFLDGKYMRVHRSIYSTRMDIKNIHAKLEHKLVNILEPLSTIAHSLGFEYYSGLIERIWKEMLKNHAHDSIACCCSDKVHKEIMYRFFIAEDMIDNLIEFYKRKIVDAIDDNIDKIALFNTLPYERNMTIRTKVITKLTDFSIVSDKGKDIKYNILSKSVIDSGLIDRQLVHYENYEGFNEYVVEFASENMPAIGYIIYYVSDKPKTTVKEYKEEDVSFIENEFYRVSFNNNGSINIYDKESREEHRDMLIFEDAGDDGDEYNYSPPRNDFIIYSTNVKAECISVMKGLYSEKYSASLAMSIPQNLESRSQKKLDEKINLGVIVELKKYSKIINISLDIENKSIEHRLRVLIPTKISSMLSFSDNQFGTIERDTVDKAISIWEKEGWKEKPVSIYPMMSFVDLNNDEKGVSVITNGLREYEIINEKLDTIAITLFRSVGVIGKEELLWRPGRPSGIKMPTYDSLMLGRFSFDLGIHIHKGDHIKASIAKYAKEYSSPITAYNKIPYNAMKLNAVSFNTPSKYSMFEVLGELVISAIKKSENSDNIVIRVFNPSSKNNASSILKGKKIESAFYIDLLENSIEEIDVKENLFTIKDIRPCEFKTILIK